MDHVSCFVLSILHHWSGQRRVVIRFVQKRFVKITDERHCYFTSDISPVVAVLKTQLQKNVVKYDLAQNKSTYAKIRTFSGISKQ